MSSASASQQHTPQTLDGEGASSEPAAVAVVPSASEPSTISPVSISTEDASDDVGAVPDVAPSTSTTLFSPPFMAHTVGPSSAPPPPTLFQIADKTVTAPLDGVENAAHEANAPSPVAGALPLPAAPVSPATTTDAVGTVAPPSLPPMAPSRTVEPLSITNDDCEGTLQRLGSVGALGDSVVWSPTAPPSATANAGALPSALKGAVPGRVRVHRRQTSIITPEEMSPVVPPSAQARADAGFGAVVTSAIQSPTGPRGSGEVIQFVKPSTIAPLQRTHSGHLLATPSASFSRVPPHRHSGVDATTNPHHRRVSSYLSTHDAEARALNLAVSGSAAFPASDFHRPTHAGAITVLSEVVAEGNRRVFRPSEVTISVGDTVIFRWYGNHKVAQIDAEGLPIQDGYGATGLPTRNGELVVTFDKVGVYFFESLNHHRCLRATVSVMDHQLIILETMLRYFVALVVAAAIVALTTAAVYLGTHGRHLFVPNAPTDGTDDGYGEWRMVETHAIDQFLPWAAAAVTLLVLGAITGVARGCRRTRLADFGRGYSERLQATFQLAVFGLCLVVLLLVFVQWLLALQANHGFVNTFSVFLDGVMNLINSAAATLADVKYLMTVAPQLSSAAQVPASANDMVQEIDTLITTVKNFSSLGQTVVNAVFRGLAILLFLTLQSYLYVISSGFVGVRRRRSTTMGASLVLTFVGLMLVMFNVGAGLFLVDTLTVAKNVMQDFSDRTLTPAKLQRYIGVSPNSEASKFIGACNADGVLSVRYINDQVQQLVAMWNEHSPPDLFLQAQIGNFTNVLVLNEYMDYLVSQIDTIQAKLDGNTTFSRSVAALLNDFGNIYVPALRASLRVVKTLLTLVDCTAFRDVVTPVLPVVRNDVIGGLEALVAVQYVQLVALIAYLYASLVAAHVFDRPYKYWYEPKTQRWFRFRACFLAHRRLLMKARFVHNVSLRGSLKNSPEASSDHIHLMLADAQHPPAGDTSLQLQLEAQPASLPPRAPSVKSVNASMDDPLAFTHSRRGSNVTSLNTTVNTLLGNKSLTWEMVAARSAAAAAQHHSRNTSLVGANTTVSSVSAPSESVSRVESAILPVVASPQQGIPQQPTPQQATAQQAGADATHRCEAVLLGGKVSDAAPATTTTVTTITGPTAPAAVTAAAQRNHAPFATSASQSTSVVPAAAASQAASPDPLPRVVSNVEFELDSGMGSRTSTLSNLAGMGLSLPRRLPSPSVPRDPPNTASGNTTATTAAAVAAAPAATAAGGAELQNANSTADDGTVIMMKDVSLTVDSEYGGDGPVSNPASPHSRPGDEGWSLTELTDHELQFDAAYRYAQWFPPSKCSTCSLVSGMHQASLLSGAMLLWQAGLLLALHISYADNHLGALLQTATGLSVLFPILTWPADAMDDVRIRVGLRIGGFCTAIAIFNLLLVSAGLDLSQTNYCITHGSNTSSSDTSLEYLSGPCSIDVTLRDLQSGVAALIVATSCAVALISSGFMTVFAKHRVSNSISTLFAEKAAATDDVEMKSLELGDGTTTASPTIMGSDLEDSPRASEAEFSRLDDSNKAVNGGSAKFAKMRSRLRRLVKQRARLRRLRCLRLGYMVLLALLLVLAIIFTAGLLLGHWFSKSDSTSNTLVNDPAGCNGDVRWCAVPINEFAWFTTHNSMSALDQQFIGPNHYFGMPKQLEAGIRAFMIDAHPYPEWSNQTEAYEAWLCHDDCRLGGYKLLRDLLLIKASMQQYPNDVYVLVFEQYTNDSAVVAAFEQAGLVDAIWTPPGSPKYNWTNWRWPTLGGLVAQGKRLIVWTDNPKKSSIADMGARRPAWYGFMWDYMFESDYANEVLSDLKCRIGRGEELMPDNVTMSPLIKLKMSALNHFLTAPVAAPFLATEANAADILREHYTRCYNEWGMVPNFIAVDFWDVQSPGVTVQQINYAAHP